MMRLRRMLAGACGLMVLAVCGTACASPADKLQPIATSAVREKASGALGELRGATPRTPESIERAVANVLLKWNTGGATVLLEKDVPVTGRFTARFAFLALVGDGFVGQYVQYAVRLCVSYSGEVGRIGSVEMADLTCPPGLPDPSDSVPVDRDVKLTG
ncbi:MULTISPECIES: hypothetical protein [unclassified Amycolatopsis]|uniref:hypothetical protein n=1 Tax=unclassified Amycolatopsis TaxID=2618356 RepID=UPI001C6A055A|nr:hypothetical protein [Amycolatopsis sp. DSM 110486]QYN23657.1 hypothetical protein K1T34_15105 [Amycolatopsis sp. DSM 110486]